MNDAKKKSDLFQRAAKWPDSYVSSEAFSQNTGAPPTPNNIHNVDIDMESETEQMHSQNQNPTFASANQNNSSKNPPPSGLVIPIQNLAKYVSNKAMLYDAMLYNG